MNKVKELASASTIYLRVKDLGDLVLDFAFNFDRRWRRYNPIGDLVRSCGLEHGDVEDGMNTMNGVGESEGEGM